MEPTNEVRIPKDLVDIFHLAKEAFVTYEELTGEWEVNSLARFRDALDHIISAADISNNHDEMIEKLAQAKEHLSEVIAEPFKDAILSQLADARQYQGWISLRRFSLSGVESYYKTASELRASSNESLRKARLLQGKISVAENQEMLNLLNKVVPLIRTTMGPN